jgi:hypothetical protein
MGVYVTDGLLLGFVLPQSDFPTSINEDDIRQNIENIVTVNQDDDAKALCHVSNPYQSDGNMMYVGFFWEASQRRAMDLDDQWNPLYQERKDSEGTIQQEKYSILRRKLFENIQSYFPPLHESDIRLYEARYFS